MIPMPATPEEAARQQQEIMAAISQVDPFLTPRRITTYGIHNTGKTYQGIELFRALMRSRVSRGLPPGRLLRIAGEASGNSAIQPYVDAGMALNIELTRVTDPSKYTAELFLQQLASGRFWVKDDKTKTGVRGYLIGEEFSMLWIEGIDGFADLIAQHLAAGARPVTDPTSPGAPVALSWTSRAPDENGELTIEHNSAIMNRDHVGKAQDAAVLGITGVLQQSIPLIYLTSHERTAVVKDTSMGTQGDTLDRMAGPLLFKNAGTPKILPKLDMLLHHEIMPDGTRRVYFENHPDPGNPRVSWVSTSRLAPNLLNQFKLWCTGGQPFFNLMPSAPGAPSVGIPWFLQAAEYFQRLEIAQIHEENARLLAIYQSKKDPS